MKPLHLNLAARPYRDYRPVYATVVVLSLLTAFLMLNNVETYYRYVRETKTTRAKIAELEQQVNKEREEEQRARQRLQSLDLTRLDQQTKFINTKLAERAFSWSQLLDELESVLADDVRLTNISPRIRTDGVVDLSLTFQAKSNDGMITTINRMNADPQFEDAFPGTESQIEGGGYIFVLKVLYLPSGRNALRTAGVLR